MTIFWRSNEDCLTFERIVIFLTKLIFRSANVKVLQKVQPAHQRLLMFMSETQLCILAFSFMSSRSEWNLLKEKFDALRRDESAREDGLEQLLDHQIRRRFGQAIARARGDQTDYGVRSQPERPHSKRC